MPNQQLAKELNKQIMRKFEKRKEFGGTDLANIQLISKYNKGFQFLLCVIDIFNKLSMSCYHY